MARTAEYNDYMNSPRWRQMSQACRARDNFTCQKCGSKRNLQAHHLTYDRLGREKLDDLLTLCKSCHEEVHRRKFNKKNSTRPYKRKNVVIAGRSKAAEDADLAFLREVIKTVKGQ